MVKQKFYSIFIFTCLFSTVFFLSGSFLQANQDNLCSKISEHFPLLALIRCASHIPEIIYADTDSQSIKKITSSLSMLASNAKLAHELSREAMVISSLLYNLPKSTAYATASLYNLVEIIDAQNITEKNRIITQKSDISFNAYKKNQAIKLGTEICVRLLALLAHYSNHKTIAWVTSEAADLIEIWRLLTRISMSQEVLSGATSSNTYSQEANISSPELIPNYEDSPVN